MTRIQSGSESVWLLDQYVLMEQTDPCRTGLSSDHPSLGHAFRFGITSSQSSRRSPSPRWRDTPLSPTPSTSLTRHTVKLALSYQPTKPERRQADPSLAPRLRRHGHRARRRLDALHARLAGSISFSVGLTSVSFLHSEPLDNDHKPHTPPLPRLRRRSKPPTSDISGARIRSGRHVRRYVSASASSESNFNSFVSTAEKTRTAPTELSALAALRDFGTTLDLNSSSTHFLQSLYPKTAISIAWSIKSGVRTLGGAVSFVWRCVRWGLPTLKEL